MSNSKDQAGIVFNECKAQIEASRYVAPRFRTGPFLTKYTSTGISSC